MAELTPAAHDWLKQHQQAVLVTLRADGSPQSSNVLASYDGKVFRVSVTSGRAKTHNLQRDPRALMHLVGDDFWHYASVACTAEVGPVTEAPGDDAGRALLDLYETITAKPHPDPDEFFGVQVDEHRLVLSSRPTSITGSGW